MFGKLVLLTQSFEAKEKEAAATSAELEQAQARLNTALAQVRAHAHARRTQEAEADGWRRQRTRLVREGACTRVHAELTLFSPACYCTCLHFLCMRMHARMRAAGV